MKKLLKEWKKNIAPLSKGEGRKIPQETVLESVEHIWVEGKLLKWMDGRANEDIDQGTM